MKLLPIWFTLFKTSLYVIHYKLLLLAHRLLFWAQEHIETYRSSNKAVEEPEREDNSYTNNHEQLNDKYTAPSCATPNKRYGQKKSAQVHYPHSMTP